MKKRIWDITITISSEKCPYKYRYWKKSGIINEFFCTFTNKHCEYDDCGQKIDEKHDKMTRKKPKIVPF